MTTEGTASRPSWIVGVTFLALVGALGVSITWGSEDNAAPLVWFGLTSYLALRYRRESWVPALYVPAATLFFLWFAKAAVGVCLPFLVGLLLAYLLDPIIDRLEPRLGRSRAIGVVAVPTLVGLGALLVLGIPSLVSELARLGSRLPELRESVQEFYGWVIDQAARLGIEMDRDSLTDLAMERVETLGAALRGAGLGLARGVQGVVDVISFLVIMPVVTFYLLRDFDRLLGVLDDHVPQDRRAGARDFLSRVDRSISAYLRGQLVVGLVIGVLFAVGLSLLGVDYAVMVGLSAVVLNLIPFVGSVLTAVLAICAAVLTDPSLISLAKVAGLYAVVQLLDSSVISPRVMGQSLDLHPAFVMLALLLAGRFFGFMGVLVAVPAAALLKESLRVYAPQVVSLLPGIELDESTP